MQWDFVTALALAIPFIIAPIAFVWYLNIAGVLSFVKEKRRKAILPAPESVQRQK